ACARQADGGGAAARHQPEGAVGKPQAVWPRLIRFALDALAAVVFAPGCAACGELLDAPTDGPVCDRCWRSILPLTPPLCDACGDPLPSWRVTGVAERQCARCRRSPRVVDHARAIGAYDGALRAVIHALKYDGRRSLARPIAAM